MAFESLVTNPGRLRILTTLASEERRQPFVEVRRRTGLTDGNLATHARRHPIDKQTAGVQRRHKPRPSRPSASSPSVTRKVDASGNVSFAGANYRVGSAYRRRQVQVAVVGDTVEISVGEQLIRSHRVKHDRTREHGALANPGGRPHRTNAA